MNGGRSLRQFWLEARGFWRERPATAWGLVASLVICTMLQLALQYRLNFWTRDFFNALEQRNGAETGRQAQMLLLFVTASVCLAIFAVWARMTFQRSWREWLTDRLVGKWLRSLARHPSDFVAGERQNAEYRIAEDARIATDAPIDLVVGLLAAVLGASTFVFVLWSIGGTLELSLPGATIQLQGYLVIAALVYSLLTATGMVWVGRHMVDVIERKNQAQADLKYALARMHEQPDDVPMVEPALSQVIEEWRRLCGQHMRTTLVSQANTLLAPVVGLLLCVPNYVRGGLTLGEVTQAAAAFFAVQAACNWLIDNYPRLAEWLSSASRVGSLLGAIGQTEGKPRRARSKGRLSSTT